MGEAGRQGARGSSGSNGDTVSKKLVLAFCLEGYKRKYNRWFAAIIMNKDYQGSLVRQRHFSWTFCCDPQTIGFNWHYGLQRTFWPRWRTGKTCLENATLICMPQQYRFGFDGRPFLRHLGYGASWGVLETTMQRGHFKMEYRSWNSSSTNSHTSTLWRVRHGGKISILTTCYRANQNQGLNIARPITL